jgi:hypothetical protein
MIAPRAQVAERWPRRIVDAQPRWRAPKLHVVEWQQTENITEGIVEDPNIDTGPRSSCERFPVGPAHCVSPYDVVVEEKFCVGVLDQLQHCGERIGAVSQQAHAIRVREGTPGCLCQSGLETALKRSDRIQTPRILNRLERHHWLLLTRVLVSGPAHSTALLQKRSDAEGHLNRRFNQIHLLVEAYRQAACASGEAR